MYFYELLLALAETLENTWVYAGVAALIHTAMREENSYKKNKEFSWALKYRDEARKTLKDQLWGARLILPCHTNDGKVLNELHHLTFEFYYATRGKK